MNSNELDNNKYSIVSNKTEITVKKNTRIELDTLTSIKPVETSIMNYNKMNDMSSIDEEIDLTENEDSNNINIESLNDNIKQPKKRGRKPKVIPIVEETKDPPEIKKRGRKPTCKILNKSDLINIKRETMDECLIVQLPICKNELDKIILDTELKRKTEKKEETLKDDTKNINNLIDRKELVKKSIDFEEKQIVIPETNISFNIVDKCSNCDKLKKTIDEIETKYHIYKINNTDKEIYNISIKLEDYYNNTDIWSVEKYSNMCCWWCCHKFDTLAIGLPEKYNNGVFKVIGYYCSFECALAYNLSLNDHKLWERTSLLYYLRNLIFKGMYPNNDISTMNDIIAASPRFLLKMFGGYLTIEEFREKSTLLKKQYRNIVPPIISIVSQLEESTYSQEQNIVIKPIKNKIIDNRNVELVLKRNKPIANKSSLMSSMGIKFNQ